MNWDKGFSRKEFACKCRCGFDTVDVALYDILVAVREHFNKSVTINSGCRCAVYNAKIGGAKNSQHVKARAADIVVKDVSVEEVYAYLDNTFGIKISLGRYKTFTHVDTRTDSPARWG